MGADLHGSSRRKHSVHRHHQPSALSSSPVVEPPAPKPDIEANVMDVGSMSQVVTGLAAVERKNRTLAFRGCTFCTVAAESREANMLAAAHASGRTSLPIQLHL